MTRTELRNFVKDKFKAMNFQSSKSYLYKIFDDDYLIGFYLNPTGRSKGYYFTCGIIYLPDENKMPIRGIFDLQWDFIFPWEESDTINISECIEKKDIELCLSMKNILLLS